MTTAFFLSLTAWTPGLDRLAALLAPDELARRERFRRVEDAARYTLARGGLRRRLGWELDRDPHGLRFGIGPHGKPHLEGDAAGREFNVSHAGDWVLIGIGRGERALGVDVERTESARDLLALAERFFTAREHAALSALPAGERRAAAFFRLWTRKEACAKACGEGLTATLEGCEALPPEPGPAEGVVLAGRWRVWDLPVPTPRGYDAALALEGSAPCSPPVVQCWRPGADQDD